MGLKTYRQKRDFDRTPEPTGRRPPASDHHRYVIQKHAASRLHYDFRLEYDGVLKSWAVPKGPSLNPKDKRLAVQVEDHPVEYGNFEGTIPEGEYGAGSVLLWDRGQWMPTTDVEAGLRKGALKFHLEGEKLKGGWALVRLHNGRASHQKPNWLLIKEKDKAAATRDILKERPESVASGREIEDIPGKRGRVWHSDQPAQTDGERTQPRKSSEPNKRKPKHRIDPSTIPGARKAPLPAVALFELSTLTATAPDGDDWLHEIKLDGYRIQCRIRRGSVTLITRTGLDWTHRFPQIAAAARQLPADSAIIDGEIVVLRPDGRTSFQALQQTLQEGQNHPLVYFAFDLPYLAGYDLSAGTLEDRKKALEPLIAAAGQPALRYSDHIIGGGAKFFHEACRLGVEGIMSKLRSSPYRPGRGRDWLKVKCLQRQEFVIGGYSEPSGSRKGLGALLLGVYDEDKTLRYAGRVGTGFNEDSLRMLGKRLHTLQQDRSPFDQRVPDSTRGVHWVKPQLVAEVAFTEWTGDGRLRHPSFQGLREDKKPRDVKREVPQHMKPAKTQKRTSTAGRSSAPSGKVRLRARGEETMNVAGVQLTRATKVLYPDQGITKGDLAHYYEAVAERMLPHIAKRPLMILRCPEGHQKQCFHQKHVTDSVPPHVKSVPVKEEGKTTKTLMVDDLAGLIALVQMGTLEVHVWGSRAEKLEYPDRLIFDLDPDTGLPWRRVIEAARLLKDRLEDLGLKSWVKTTGGKGLHVVVPLQPKQDWPTVKSFARAFAESVVHDAPDRYTSNMAKAQRKGKIFIDYLRNGRGATAVATYSTRARTGAPVSWPIGWKELGRTDPKQFTVSTMARRSARIKADPWKGFDTSRQSLTQAMLRKMGMT